MTAEDLIVYLQKLPKGTIIGCVFLQCSDICPLEEHMLEFFDKAKYDEQASEIRRGRGPWVEIPQYIVRNGQIMEYSIHTFPPEEIPQFVSVLVFPGY